ncbi:hypothetical protein ACFVWN_31950 [Nocardiopsis flavescens]|uniref:hypothetical protein n=1 Tax=Nocardiopsis flavescens TaxID=758803 RepID=UPI00364E8999
MTKSLVYLLIIRALFSPPKHTDPPCARDVAKPKVERWPNIVMAIGAALTVVISITAIRASIAAMDRQSEQFLLLEAEKEVQHVERVTYWSDDTSGGRKYHISNPNIYPTAIVFAESYFQSEYSLSELSRVSELPVQPPFGLGIVYTIPPCGEISFDVGSGEADYPEGLEPQPWPILFSQDQEYVWWRSGDIGPAATFGRATTESVPNLHAFSDDGYTWEFDRGDEGEIESPDITTLVITSPNQADIEIQTSESAFCGV